MKMFSPQDYCENCLRIPGHYYYAKKEDCICTCHKDNGVRDLQVNESEAEVPKKAPK